MSGRKNESKLKSMLERRGLIKKVYDGPEKDSLNETITRYNPDIKPIIDTGDDSVTIKSAARHPVPGMTAPTFPEEHAVEGDPQQAEAVTPAAAVNRFAAGTPGEDPFAEEYSPPEPREYTPPQVDVDLNQYRNALESTSAEQPIQEQAYTPQRPSAENYTERYLSINELYEALALRPRKTDSIYLIEEYLKTLPSSLPDSSRRDIVNKIISASGFDYDLLMGDGVLRVKMLKEYAERFARHTDDYIAARQADLESLEQQIGRTKKLLENRKELHKRQFITIETEAQRLKEILTFVSG